MVVCLGSEPVLSWWDWVQFLPPPQERLGCKRRKKEEEDGENDDEEKYGWDSNEHKVDDDGEDGENGDDKNSITNKDSEDMGKMNMTEQLRK